ncbi:MAG: class I SAM-dependent methyltransferase [Hyphomonadaceae bacterium]|nr:class I SAM-dependent methyltransferase [Hyphomonadaceae bacterium]
MRMTLMRSLAVAALLATAACETMGGGAPVTATSANIVAAVADPARPQADKDRDVNRKPAEMVAFGEVQPGDKVGELVPGGGYMTRILSKAVGPTGKVYAFASAPVQREGQPPPAAPLAAVVADPANYGNVKVVISNYATLANPEPLDLVWTSQNYHDLHNPGRNLDINAANKAVLNALKPGGIYIVLDHQIAKGQEFSAENHRIDEAKVKAEVLAAGFQFVGSSGVLRNPADDGTKTIFDPSIRGKTDQFILKFKKPG